MSEPTAVESADDTTRDREMPSTDITVPIPTDRQPEDSSNHVGLDVPKTQFGLTFNDQRFLGILIAVMLVLMGWHWAKLSGWGMKPVEVDRLPVETVDERIDINTATWVEFTQLESIGETLAERIVTYREQHGRFNSVDELLRVKGIGKKTLAKIRRYLVVKPE